MKSLFLLSRQNRSLLKGFVRTDFKLRYQNSVIGYLWSILYPLMYFTVLYLVFVNFFGMGAGLSHWPVALLLAIAVWTFFTEAIGRGMVTIVNNGGLLRKIYFPKTILVYSEISGAGINFGLNMIVLLVFMLISQVQPNIENLLLIPLMVELLLFTAGISLILSTIYVRFRDISMIWNVLTQLLFYAVPIVYPLSMIKSKSVLLAKIVMLNPLAQIINDMRRVLLGSGGGSYQYTFEFIISKPLAMIPYLLSILLFVFGYFIFTRNSADFAEVL